MGQIFRQLLQAPGDRAVLCSDFGVVAKDVTAGHRGPSRAKKDILMRSGKQKRCLDTLSIFF